jgi:hypothetical protein
MDSSPTMEEVETRRDHSQQTRQSSINLDGGSVQSLDGLFTIDIERASARPDFPPNISPLPPTTDFESLDFGDFASLYTIDLCSFPMPEDSNHQASKRASSSWSQSRSPTPFNDQQNLTESTCSSPRENKAHTILNIPQENGRPGDQAGGDLNEKDADVTGIRHSGGNHAEGKSRRALRDLPAPMTIHTSLKFLDKFERIDSATTAVDEITTVTPTSLGMPPPPSLNTPAGPPPIGWSRPHEIAFIINVCLAQFITLAALAQTVAPLLLIGEELKVKNPGQLSWFTAAYSMTLGTFILPAGMYYSHPYARP